MIDHFESRRQFVELWVRLGQSDIGDCEELFPERRIADLKAQVDSQAGGIPELALHADWTVVANCALVVSDGVARADAVDAVFPEVLVRAVGVSVGKRPAFCEGRLVQGSGGLVERSKKAVAGLVEHEAVVERMGGGIADLDGRLLGLVTAVIGYQGPALFIDAAVVVAGRWAAD